MMKTIRIVEIRQSESAYPAGLKKYLKKDAPKSIQSLGNLGILQGRSLCLLCSIRCPGELILQAFDSAKELRERGVTVISGFHSPVEKECLRILLRGKQPIVICLAREIEKMRIPTEWKKPLEEGRLLILSSFGSKCRRPTAVLSQKRNEFAAALADLILVVYASPGSKTEAFVHRLINTGRRVGVFTSPYNANLAPVGAVMNKEAVLKKLAVSVK